MRRARWILFGFFTLCLAVVVFRNLEQTNVELIVTTVKMPLAALLTITLAIGFLMGLFASALLKVRRWRKGSKTIAETNE